MVKGQKPDVTIMNEVKNSLLEKSNDSEIFHELEKIVLQSWETKPEHRPKVSEVKKRLETLAQSKQIYDEATDKNAETIVESRKFQLMQAQLKKRPVKTILKKQSVKWVVSLAILPMFVALVSLFIGNLHTKLDFAHHDSFVGINNGRLLRYNVYIKNISFFSYCDKPNALPYNFRFKPYSMITASGLIYAFGRNRDTDNFIVQRLNLSSPCWTDIYWGKQYQNRNYITFNDNILAIGARDDLYHDMNHLDGTDALDMYNMATGKWSSL